MKANEANLFKVINQPQQFIIPIYQRTYNWKEKQCEQLFKDILHISRDDKRSGHFIGSIVYFQESIYTSSTVPQRLVIDGQQRLATITLIIAALLQKIKEFKIDIQVSEQKLRNYYLFNIEEEDDLKYKLLLTKKDKQTLIDILEERTLDNTASRLLARNFNYFLSKINSDNIHHVLDGLQRLFIVDVALEYEKDNPQLIFESLNSTGLDLSCKFRRN